MISTYKSLRNRRKEIYCSKVRSRGCTSGGRSERQTAWTWLLLASDFEDFSENLFKDSGADDHISKPFKSDDIIKRVADLLSEDTPTQTGETIELTAADMDKVVEPTEGIVKLSADNLIEEVNSTIKLTT